MLSRTGPKLVIVDRSCAPLPSSAEREELDRGSAWLPVGGADLGGALGGALAGRAGRGDAGQVALDVGQQHRHACSGQLLRHQLQRLGLARPGRSGDESVPVHHGQRQPHLSVRQNALVDDQRTKVDGWTVGLVGARDCTDQVAFLHASDPRTRPHRQSSRPGNLIPGTGLRTGAGIGLRPDHSSCRTRWSVDATGYASAVSAVSPTARHAGAVAARRSVNACMQDGTGSGGAASERRCAGGANRPGGAHA